jgi:predicted aldo/keto reductase-like oxidoreductase
MSQPLNKEKSVQNRFKAVEVPKQEPQERIKNFKEVVLGYTEEQAIAEASRCLNCKNAQCIAGCPVGIDIQHSFNASPKKTTTQPSQKSKRKTVYQPSVDEYAHKKNNAKQNAFSAKKANQSPSVASNATLQTLNAKKA